MASWKEAMPGRFERPLDSIERFLANLARDSIKIGREYWSISAFAQFEVQGSQEDVKSALRQAWKTMRYDHPQLACTEHEGVIVYEVPDDTALEAWLEKTFIVKEASMDKDAMFASFQPSGLATLHFWPKTSEIMFHSSHWRIDFIGALGLLQNLFRALQRPRHVRFGSEGSNLSLARDKAGGYTSLDELRSDMVAKERSTSANDLTMQFVGNLPSVGLPAQNIQQAPRGTRRSEIVLNSEQTQSIVDASKLHGHTVTVAFHAAQTVVLQRLSPIMPSPSNTYTSFGIHNVRPLPKAPSNDIHLHPVAVYIVGFPLVLHSSTYMDHVDYLKIYYKHNTLTLADARSKEGILATYTNQMADFVDQDTPPEVPLSSEPLFSSIGIIDDYLKPNYGTMKVKEFWAGVEMTTPQVTCYLWTWQGQMTGSACYNETFYEKTFIEYFLKRIISVLEDELNIRIS